MHGLELFVVVVVVVIVEVVVITNLNGLPATSVPEQSIEPVDLTVRHGLCKCLIAKNYGWAWTTSYRTCIETAYGVQSKASVRLSVTDVTHCSTVSVVYTSSVSALHSRSGQTIATHAPSTSH
jgi:hypothetical protein